uniref:NADH dehydrogenase [ubiquinone] 1 subunit C1, mitochondrial n=1 Tax=Astatotilapia calliptera TaxID=8154 RepID=A0A3P8NYP0_ASTCA
MTFNRLLSRAVFVSRAGCRSAFTSSKPDMTNPNWFRVGLAFGTTAFLWGLLTHLSLGRRSASGRDLPSRHWRSGPAKPEEN